MRLTVVFLLALLLFANAGEKTTVKNDGDWVRFSSKEGRFSVLFPKAPTYSKEKDETAVGDIVIHNYMPEPSRTVAYSVMFNELPKKMRDVAKDHSDALFDGGQKSALGADGMLVRQRDFKFHGHDARELQFVRHRTALVTMRLYLTKDRLYQTISIVHTNQAASTNIARFLDSFRLTK